MLAASMAAPDKPQKKQEPSVVAAKFIAAGQKLSDLPDVGHPEIAFAGRSNVGKSSLLNSLMQRRSLVRTSKTPGATRTVNLFEAILASGEVLTFADLPGYGFAARSKTERASFGPMLEGYLQRRAELRGVVILIDVRRGPVDDDEALVEFLRAIDRPLPVVACVTKIDKLSVSAQKPAVAKIAKALSVPAFGVSAVTHEGRGRALASILAMTRPTEASEPR